MLDHTFRGLLGQVDTKLGGLAVVYDKNPMEATGYGAVMADLMKEQVFLVEYHDKDPDPSVKWVDRLMHIRDDQGGEFIWPRGNAVVIAGSLSPPPPLSASLSLSSVASNSSLL